ncbi:ERF family protein [Streptomyces xanthophaeus]|uniref:ERF family protein n=1 Tax=Streptomyces xanthophaeus TaxID=67385 RepID=UPI0036B4C0AF
MTVTTLPTPLTDPRVTPELAARLIEAVTGPGTLPAPAPTTYEPAPDGTPADAPRIFAAINAVMRDTMPVGKNQQNTQQNYKFRGIDDVMSAMAGPMRSHGVFILPTIAGQRQDRDGKMTRTNITMRYRVYGPAGDCLIAEVPGEASDFADKSTNKAQSAALKYLLFTLFMLPVDGRSIDDGDRDHPTQPTTEHRAEHAQRQQQRQQRGQARQQQRQQQPRRTERAEPGPWEQPPAPAPAPQAAPHRDYLAEAVGTTDEAALAAIVAAARQQGAPGPYLSKLDDIREAQGAPDVAAVRKLYDAAQTAGADREHLARLAAIGGTKPGAKPQGTPAGPVPHPDAVAAEGAVPATAEQAAADAEQRLRLAASRADLVTLDADFERVYGLPIEQATAPQLDQFRAKVEAAGGAR